MARLARVRGALIRLLMLGDSDAEDKWDLMPREVQVRLVLGVIVGVVVFTVWWRWPGAT
jgi:Mg/Co/Ni transporter MgtE